MWHWPVLSRWLPQNFCRRRLRTSVEHSSRSLAVKLHRDRYVYHKKQKNRTVATRRAPNRSANQPINNPPATKTPMCGIARTDPLANLDVARSATLAMTDAQRHRGPDADGTAGVADVRYCRLRRLGSRRLSILDLSPLGRQPMVEPASGNVLVFNGEIYNFAELKADLAGDGVLFRSTGDTEVLVHALTRWGVPKTLRRLEGMFAFAWLDCCQHTLTLARDPLGIKPLYLANTTDGGIAFASEVRAILKVGTRSQKG